MAWSFIQAGIQAVWYQHLSTTNVFCTVTVEATVPEVFTQNHSNRHHQQQHSSVSCSSPWCWRDRKRSLGLCATTECVAVCVCWATGCQCRISGIPSLCDSSISARHWHAGRLHSLSVTGILLPAKFSNFRQLSSNVIYWWLSVNCPDIFMGMYMVICRYFSEVVGRAWAPWLRG